MAKRLGYQHQRLDRCRRCGKDLEYGVHTTHRAFCSQACSDTWWCDLKSRRETRSEVAEKITGRKAPAFDWTDSQAAWLAALIDGEGTIGIWKEKRTGNKSGVRYKAAIEVANTNTLLIDAMAALIDGWTRKDSLRKVTHHKQCYRVRVSQRAVLPTLERVVPFLVAKKQQAEIVMQFCRTLGEAPARTASMTDIFEAMYQEMKQLNWRGAPEA